MTDVRALATDAVVVLDGNVLLLKRDHSPFEGRWVLPGGLVESHERAREACVRETREEAGIEVEAVSFVGLYDDPDRGERGKVSAAYRCRPTGANPTPRPREEATRVDAFDPADLPPMGFDHREIVADALDVE